MGRCSELHSNRLKIGIVTWFNSGNFGTILQAIGLYDYLSKDNDCYFMEYCDTNKITNAPLFETFFYKAKLIIKWIFFDTVLFIIRRGNIKKGYKIAKLFRKYKKCSTLLAMICNKLRGFDCFITGSDQIWNPYYLSEFYLLSFVPASIPRLSYSSSIGIESIPTGLEEIYQRNLSKFKNIAVREKVAENLLKTLLKRNDVRTVLDPVFLLSAKEWKEKFFIQQREENYIFCYFIGNTIDNSDAIAHIKDMTKIKRIICVPSEEYQNIQLSEKDETAGVEDFISYIVNAALVCTDSFHATAFSLIFNKQFIVFKRFFDNDKKSQNSRLLDMLSEYGLSKRMYRENFCYESIDYDFVNPLLEKNIADSKSYLRQVLAECKK